MGAFMEELLGKPGATATGPEHTVESMKSRYDSIIESIIRWNDDLTSLTVENQSKLRIYSDMAKAHWNTVRRARGKPEGGLNL